MAEGHHRLASPLYNIAFMALALNAILGAGFSRTGYGKRIAMISAIAISVRILGFVVQAACESEAWLNVAQYGIPLAATYFSLRGVFRQRVSRFIDIRRRAPGGLIPGAA